jgi:hypothetical protein
MRVVLAGLIAAAGLLIEIEHDSLVTMSEE